MLINENKFKTNDENFIRFQVRMKRTQCENHSNFLFNDVDSISNMQFIKFAAFFLFDEKRSSSFDEKEEIQRLFFSFNENEFQRLFSLFDDDEEFQEFSSSCDDEKKFQEFSFSFEQMIVDEELMFFSTQTNDDEHC